MLTKRDLLRSAALAAITATTTKAVPASAQAKAEWPGIIEAKAIAEDGFIYGLPIVMNYAVMYEYSVDKNSGQYKAPFNHINNEARVFTYKDTAVITPNSDTPYSLLWLDLRAEPDGSFSAGCGEDALLLRDAVRRQHVQLRLHRQPRHRQRRRRLSGRWAELAGCHTARHQEGIPVHDTVFCRCLPHAALQSGRHAEC